MKIKHKIEFISLIAFIDLIVIVLVVINNDKTNIKNDVINKNSANILEVVDLKRENEENAEEAVINESVNENIVSSDLSTDIVETPDENNIAIDSYVAYDDMTMEEKEAALYDGTLTLEYSNLYTYSSDRLTTAKGAINDFNGHRETYYSEKVLPGNGLNIPGRHVAEDGTIRDEDGYICVAADQSYMEKGSILITSLGPAKVYDTGCAYGTIDIYVNW